MGYLKCGFRSESTVNKPDESDRSPTVTVTKQVCTGVETVLDRDSDCDHLGTSSSSQPASGAARSTDATGEAQVELTV